MSEKFKSSFRGYLIDHHSPAPPIVSFDKLDMAEYERFYEEAGINSLMVYTKDHWGYSYYDTKIGTKHPGLSIDYIGEVSRILKKHDIEFNAYYCLEYDTLAPVQHPKWAIRDKDGNPVRLRNRISPAKWGMPCYETGYRDYVLGQLKEVVTQYHPDSLFLDIFGKSLCYCDSCKKKFKERYGYDLPEKEGTVEGERVYFDFGWQGHDVNEFLEDCAYEMLKDVMDTVKAIDPELKVTINFAALYPKRIRDLLDYQFTEPWAGNWLSAAYSRDTSPAPCPQLGPGDVSEVYNYRPDAVYELAGAQIAANGCRAFFYSGSQHVDGTLEHTEARRVGKAYEELKRYEKYLTGREVLADIAIIQSDSSTMAKSGSRVVLNAIGRVRQPDPHKEALKGAMTLCDYAGYTWRIVPEQEMTKEEAGKYKGIILAGMFHVTDELKGVLETFRRDGGFVLAAGECGLYEKDGRKRDNFALHEMFGCDYRGAITDYSDQAYGGYLKMDDSRIFADMPETYPPMGRIQYRVSLTEGKGMGKIVSPCTPVTDTTWVNWWCPPPAEEALSDPAVVEHENCCYIAYDIFQTYELNLNRNLFCGILKAWIKTPSCYLKTPYKETVSCCVYSRPDGDDTEQIIHIVSNLAEKTNGDAPKIRPGYLYLNRALAEGKVIRQVYPKNTRLKVTEEDGYVKVKLPKLTIHTVLIVKQVEDQGA